MRRRSLHQIIFVAALIVPVVIGGLFSAWRETPAWIVLSLMFTGFVVANIPRWIRADLTNAGRRLDKQDFADARRLALRFRARMRRHPWLGPIAGVELARASPPVDILALTVLTCAHVGLEDLVAGRQTAHAALALAPDDPDVRHVMGMVELHAEGLRAAAPWFEEAEQLGYPLTAAQQAQSAGSMQFLSEAGDLRPGGRPIGAPRLKAEGPVRVDLLNDDKTPMEFVVHVLQQSFGIRYVDAVQVMLTIHTEGRASAGSFARETADAIFEEVTGLARSEGFPLQLELITEAAD